MKLRSINLQIVPADPDTGSPEQIRLIASGYVTYALADGSQMKSWEERVVTSTDDLHPSQKGALTILQRLAKGLLDGSVKSG